MMAEVDTSSYPKAQITNPLDNLQKMGNIAQQKIGIDQAKLNLINQRYGIMNRELATLIDDPELNWDKINSVGQNAVKQGLITPEMWAQQTSQFAGNMANPQALRTNLQQVLSRNMTTQEAVNWHYGQNQLVNQGSQILPMSISQNPNVGVRQAGAPIQLGTSPEFRAQPREVQTPWGTPRQTTQTGYEQGVGAPNSGQVAPYPAQRSNVLGGRQSAPAKASNPMAPQAQPKSPEAAPAPQPRAEIPGNSGYGPLEQKGVEEYTASQNRSSAYPADMTPLRTAMDVLRKMKPGETGVTRETANMWKNAATALGIAPGDKMEKDAAEFEKFSKSVAQLANSANPGSDERLRSAYSAGPSGDKTREANMYLTTQLIGLRNLQEAADRNVQKLVDNGTIGPKQVKDQIAKFKNSVDLVAFGFPTMPRAAQDAYIKGLSSEEKKRFATSLMKAKELGVIGTPAQ